jgi:hypothetical protein
MSLFTYPCLQFCMLFPFSVRDFTILIIVILNFLSDNSKISCISECGLYGFFFFLFGFFFLIFSMPYIFLFLSKARHDILDKMNCGKWVISVRFYVTLLEVRLCLMFAVALGTAKFLLVYWFLILWLSLSFPRQWNLNWVWGF